MLYPELTSVWFRVTVGTVLSLYPETLGELPVVVQVNSVPGTSEVRVTLVGMLLQICFEGGLLDRSAFETSVTI
jgi:hypothetical protein